MRLKTEFLKKYSWYVFFTIHTVHQTGTSGTSTRYRTCSTTTKIRYRAKSANFPIAKNDSSTFAIVNINKQCHWTFVAKERQTISVPDPWHFARDMVWWMLIRILGSVPFTNGSGCGSDFGPRDADPASDPALFVCDLQDANKKYFFSLSFYAYSF